MSKSPHAYLIPLVLLCGFVGLLFINCDGVKFDKAPVAKSATPPATTTPAPSPSSPSPSPGSGGSSGGGDGSGGSSDGSGGGSSGISEACRLQDTSSPPPKSSGQQCACDCGCNECLYMSDDCNECPTPNDVVYSYCSNDPGRTYRHCK